MTYIGRTPAGALALGSHLSLLSIKAMFIVCT